MKTRASGELIRPRGVRGGAGGGGGTAHLANCTASATTASKPAAN